MKVQLVTPYRVSHLQRYGVTVGGDVTSVYPPLRLERQTCLVCATGTTHLNRRNLKNRTAHEASRVLIFFLH
jgi:hypothetical protein